MYTDLYPNKYDDVVCDIFEINEVTDRKATQSILNAIFGFTGFLK